MKFRSESARRSERRGDTLAPDEGANLGVDLKSEVLRQAAEMSRNFNRSLGRALEEQNPNLFVEELSRIVLLERTFQVEILPSAIRQQAMEFARTHLMHITPGSRPFSPEFLQATGNVIGWIQLFPEERARVEIAPDYYDALKREMEGYLGGDDINSWMKVLIMLKPEQRQEILRLIHRAKFTGQTWQKRQNSFTNEWNTDIFLDSVSTYLLAFPEDREKFQISDGEKQKILKSLFPRNRNPGIKKSVSLVSLAIVLADKAWIDERGQIMIEPAKEIPGVSAPLPVRSRL